MTSRARSDAASPTAAGDAVALTAGVAGRQDLAALPRRGELRGDALALAVRLDNPTVLSFGGGDKLTLLPNGPTLNRLTGSPEPGEVALESFGECLAGGCYVG